MFTSDWTFFRSRACFGVILGVVMLVGCNVGRREVIRCSTTGPELPITDVLELSPNAGVVRLMSATRPRQARLTTMESAYEMATRPREGRLTTTESAYEMLFEASPEGHRLQLTLNRFTGKGERILGEDTVIAGRNLHQVSWTVQCEPYDMTSKS